MEAHLQLWGSLLLRWLHFIAGVAWIGASFYFNWLENHLRRSEPADGQTGDLWAVHGGGFYHVRKFAAPPHGLPPELHWFKWEAYTTWLSGMALLVIVYYWNGATLLLDPSVSGIGRSQAIAIGLGTIVVSWFVYDIACRSPLGRHEVALTVGMLAWFLVLAWLLAQALSGRAAYVHVGAAAGSIMVANVFRVIIPAQRMLVRAAAGGPAPDPNIGPRALQRSRHNNYFTLPVLFLMISSHYPATYGHAHAWAVLGLLALAGLAIRHYFNIRHRPGARAWPLIPAALLLSAGVWLSAPPAPRQATDAASLGQAYAVVARRCGACHSARPAQDGFEQAPMGIELDDEAALLRHAERVYGASVLTRSMPPGNVSGMTDAERSLLAAWYATTLAQPTQR